MEQTVVALSRALLTRHESLATAESCTGGWVAKVCTDLAGSSGWFERGLVTYSNASKQELLDVSAQTLDQYGAVSEQTVHEMVRGILHHSHAQWGLAISGIAGPDGGSASKPIGTVWIAWAGPGGWLVKRSYWFDGERDEVRWQAVETALRVLCDRLREPA
ncbi:MAG TPA: CinA family protein [Gammaproteobacteria bacterium]|nr:CinA family protein [Gammaproteobacteria bacterium]